MKSNEIAEISSHAMREKIVALERAMKSAPEIQVHIEPRHYFAPGLYLREITIPKGVTLVGMIHKTEHLCILSRGSVSVGGMDGNKVETISASTVVHSKPGAKRVIHAHEESVWINVHHNPTNERDLDAIEKIYVVDSFEKLGSTDEPKKLEGF